MIQGDKTTRFTLFSECPDITQAVPRWKETPDFVLLDVRTPQEYEGGHIPGSINVPLSRIDGISAVAENKETVLYVYCRSGMRSRQWRSCSRWSMFMSAISAALQIIRES